MEGYFPQPVSSEKFNPWIWDAVYDPEREWLEILLHGRDACSFNQTRWKEFVEWTPKEFFSQLAYGDEKNILVHWDSQFRQDGEYKYRRQSDEILLSQQFNCNFYSNLLSKTKPVYTSISLPIKGHHIFSPTGTLLIRCPLSNDIFANRQIIGFSIQHQASSGSSVNSGKLITTANSILPFCKLPHYSHNSISINEWKSSPSNVVQDSKRKPYRQYGISVCLATSRSNKKHWIEWIEYHLILGVDHFYIYDTSTNNGNYNHVPTNTLRRDLRSYIHRDIVTIVPWHFENCVRHMASGRIAEYNYNCSHKRSYNVCPHDKRGQDVIHQVWFSPPRPVAQTAAIGSCYVRFKHTSKYMMHLDEDEFLVLPTNYTLSEMKANKKSMSGKGATGPPLLAFADDIFSQFPTKSVIRFPPIRMVQCNPKQLEENYSPEILSKFGHLDRNDGLRITTWTHGSYHGDYEGKLLVKPNEVGMCFIHVLTLIDSNFADIEQLNTSSKYPIRSKSTEPTFYSKIFTTTREDAGIYHYKESSFKTRSIWGEELLNLLRKTDSYEDCGKTEIGGIMPLLQILFEVYGNKSQSPPPFMDESIKQIVNKKWKRIKKKRWSHGSKSRT